jgi:mevalonyl-CoA ligase
MKGDGVRLRGGLRILLFGVSPVSRVPLFSLERRFNYIVAVLTYYTSTGGENIYPLEIEERLVAHPCIGTAVVAGLKDQRLGEVVGAFLLPQTNNTSDGNNLPSDDEVREWVRKTLGRHKAPAHVFWLGTRGLPASVPLTGSGKVRKFELARMGERLVGEGGVRAKI